MVTPAAGFPVAAICRDICKGENLGNVLKENIYTQRTVEGASFSLQPIRNGVDRDLNAIAKFSPARRNEIDLAHVSTRKRLLRLKRSTAVALQHDNFVFSIPLLT